MVRNFTGAQSLHVKSDPDVFADALVPRPGQMMPFAPPSENPQTIVLTARGFAAGGFLCVDPGRATPQSSAAATRSGG